MTQIDALFANNRAWAARVKGRDPEFFARLSAQQAPHFLWIGCADSRVPANEIVGLPPGDVFVHRNVANQVIHADLNCLSVLQYAVDVLQIRHVIVCGHYGCGGVKAALDEERHGLVDNWLGHVRDVADKYRGVLDSLPQGADATPLLCELNVIEQVSNVGRSTVVQDAWARGQALSVHGWIYAVADGLLRDLETTLSAPAQVMQVPRRAAAASRARHS
ncbi:MAG TPA: carbonate dehydratase [Gammaproteobacteria bacterium]